MKLTIVPVTKTEARRFVNDHHRHNEAPSPMQVSIAVGLERDGKLVGVGTAGQPVNRTLAQDRFALEVNRTCSLGDKNANSMIYGALARAAKALGYRKLITYTLQEESGASLLASGFKKVADIGARSFTETKTRIRTDETLFGPRNNAAGRLKWRWERGL